MAQDTVAKPYTRAADFYQLIHHPIKFRLFLLTKLPSAYFAGLRIPEVDEDHCVVTVPYKWFTKNPFRSTYFACLSMAAEMSTGVLAMANTYQRKPAVSMLVTAMDACFQKKATGTIRFICKDGTLVKETIEKAVALNIPQTIRMQSSGYNANMELVAEFFVGWSFKAKAQ